MVNSQENGLLIISLFCFRELINTMTKGNIYAANKTSNTAVESILVIFFFITLQPPSSL